MSTPKKKRTLKYDVRLPVKFVVDSEWVQWQRECRRELSEKFPDDEEFSEAALRSFVRSFVPSCLVSACEGVPGMRAAPGSVRAGRVDEFKHRDRRIPEGSHPVLSSEVTAAIPK